MMDFGHTNVSCSNNTVCNNAENITEESYMQNDTETSNSWQEEYFPRAIFLALLLGLETIVGVLGNGTIVYLIITNKSLRNVCNFYILNRAVADLFFQLPNFLVIVAIAKMNFIFGHGSCLFFSIVCQSAFLASNVTLILMCIDCYISTRRGHHAPTFRAELLKTSMCILWIIVVALTTLYVDFKPYHEDKSNDGETVVRTTCIPGPFLFALTIVQYISCTFVCFSVPLTLTWVFIWMSFRPKSIDVPYTNSDNEGSREGQTAGNTMCDESTVEPVVEAVFRKRFIMVLATLFTITHLAYWLAVMAHIPEFGVYLPFLYEGAVTLLDINVALNPIICIAFAKDLYQEFVKLLPTHKSAGNPLHATYVRDP